MRDHGDELLPTRASLLGRLKDWRDEAGWQQFFDVYWRLIYGVARQSGLDDSEAQDAVQETMIGVAKYMPTFKYDGAHGSFKAWLLNLTRWRITDQLRKRSKLPAQPFFADDSGTGTRTQERLVDPATSALDALWDAEWQTNLLNAATARVKRRIEPQNYQLFDFYVNKEWPALKVATAFNVPVDQVYLAKHRVTELLRTEVARLEQDIA